MTPEVCSFDVYDTCLVRTLARPSDLFFLLADRMFSRNPGRDVGWEDIAELARLRISSEQRARCNSNEDDIGLRDIYESFSELAWWGISSEEMMQEEIRLEREVVRPIRAIKQRIAAFRKLGHQIIFISDMYLPAEAIRQMLLDHSIARPNDRVYVSGDIGLTKYSGKLFQYVLEQETIKPSHLRHCGDNPQSDVIMPRKLGISTSFFSKSQLNRYEIKVVKQTGLDNSCLYSQIAGVSRATRLTLNDGVDPSQLSDLAANVIGPLLTCFVAWVLQDALKNGIERLYFVSRDGQILLKIAKQLARYVPAPECCYLYGSRQAWFLPSVYQCDRQSLDWLFLHSTAPRHLLRKLNIAPEEIEDILNIYGFDCTSWDQQLETQEIKRFWQLIEHPTVSCLILKNATTAREATLAYLKQEGLYSPSRWAIVDVGWTLKAQRSLKRILERSGYTGGIYGYYLAVLKERQSISEAGYFRAFFLEESICYGNDSLTGYLVRNIHLVEQVFTIADHGPIVGYRVERERIVPNVEEDLDSPSREQFVSKLHDAIQRYADEIAKTRLIENHISDLKQAATVAVREFLSKPDRHEVTAIGWILIGDDQNEARRRTLARRLNLNDVAYYYLARIIRHVDSRDFGSGYSWFEGSLAVSGILTRLFFLPINLVIKFKRSNGFSRVMRWYCHMISNDVL